jgi:hypothetical protein
MASSVVLLGSGALARAVCSALASGALPMTVTVAARDGARAAEVAYIGNACAALTRAPVRCRSVPSHLSDPLELSRVLGATTPDIVLLAASYQSACEGLTSPSAWTRLIERAGFGLTAPLHALLAITVADVVAQNGNPRLLIASYPDAVNPILAAVGFPVFAGVGNVALLTASLRAALDVRPRTRVRVLAHHIQLRTPERPAEEARAWVNGAPVPDVTSALSAQRATDRRELNLVTAQCTAQLIRGLLAGVEIYTNLPGPLGLPGGYPVRINGDIELDLPKDVTHAEAVEWNRAAARRDGVDVDGGQVRFSEQVLGELDRYLPGFDGGFPVDALATVGARLLTLRDKLRTAPDC